MTFLFDIGKVLLDFDFGRIHLNLPPTSADPARLDPLLTAKDPYERGEIGTDDFVSQALAHLGASIARETLERAWCDIFTPNLPMWRTVERLAADGHRLLLFSNTSDLHLRWILAEYDLFRHFEAGTYSFHTGFMKPEDGIYRRAIDDHRLDPAATLYIDDLPANIETGRRFGFPSHRYDLGDHAAFERWLDAALDR